MSLTCLPILTLLAVAFAGPSLLVQARAAVATSVDFNREILPILSDNCFACHGPDEEERKARLRLDRHEDVIAVNSYGEQAVAPGDPEASLVIERIMATSPREIMPPPATGKVLSAEQIDILRRWVEEGAHWQEHWSFVAPERPVLPEVSDPAWLRNEIDSFILDRLDREGLQPSREADKATLIRRASLDVTGLPPTPQEVDAFLADARPEAYEELIDRLLASPRYGEQMARYWLDAARYADTHGYHIDAERSMWKWRDWVIDAFNENMPFDQFTIEQLAGDLIPDATVDQKIATGYIRANLSTGEGGAIEDEYRAMYAFDRLETTSTIWTGLTMTCARCHTHKYDPITHREYFQLFSFFDNLDEPVMDGNKPNPDPFLKLPTPEQSERQAWLNDAIADQQAKLDAPDPQLDSAQKDWEQRWRAELTAQLDLLMPDTVATTRRSALRVLDDGSILAHALETERETHEITLKPAAGRIAALRLETLPHQSSPGNETTDVEPGAFRLTGVEAEWVGPAKEDGKAPAPEELKLNRAWANSRDGEHAPERAIDGKTDTGWSPDRSLGGQSQGIVLALAEPRDIPEGSELRLRLHYETKSDLKAPNRFRLGLLQDGEAAEWLNPPKPPAWHVVGPFPSRGLSAGLAQSYPPETGIDLEASYEGVREEIKWQARSDIPEGRPYLLVNELHGVHGVYYLHREVTMPAARSVEVSVRADDVFKLWINDELVGERAVKEELGEGPLRLTVDLREGPNSILVKVVNLQGAAHFTFHQDLDATDRLPPPLAGRLLAGGPLTGEDATAMRNYFRRVTSPEWKELSTRTALWREENDQIEKGIVTTMIAKERTEPRETRILLRGEYDQPGEVVSRGVPAILPPLPEDAPLNRLGLAQWLVDPAHPLTARVTVNRLWLQFFGVGLVKTAEDFGVQGERPSHPELLDWLATELVRSDWDVQHVQRLLLTSAAYRQSSRTTPDLIERDPENRLLARGPRFRVDAEVIRDTALAVGGLLIEELGGRSVKPFEPPGLWEAVSFNNAQKYVQDVGDGNYRRSLYTFWKRQSPPPSMVLFDAPSREYCVVRRPRTNTPLQALALLNDPQFVEASRAFAQRILLEGGDCHDSRITFAFRSATARPPQPGEIQVLRSLLQEQRAEFEQDRASMEEFLAVGAFEADAALDPVDLAAWATVASILLNLDETLMKN
jgi:hypothetical protein